MHRIYLFSQKRFEKKLQEKLQNRPRRNNYEVCTAVARCFPNILEDLVLENVNLSEDKIGRPPLCSIQTD
jgi:hypothetical protein